MGICVPGRHHDPLALRRRSAQLSQSAWVGESGLETPPHAVGQKLPNPFGLYDLHGNVNEWCSDWWAADTYKDSPAVDPVGPASGEQHVTRGGAFPMPPLRSRSADRSYFPKYDSYAYRGFRVLCVTPAMTAAKFIPPAANNKASKTSH